MVKKRFQFRVPSKHKPSVEITNGGLYVRFQNGVKASKTIIRSEWPHVAVDIAEDNSVIGIECVPAPFQFSIGAIAKKAGVGLTSRISAADVKISSAAQESASLVAV